MIEDVIESISVEEILLSSKQIRTSETVNTARSPLPDKKKGVVEHQVPISMIVHNMESKKVVEKDQRPIEDNSASDNLGPDVTMEVVKDLDELFGCTTVPVNVDSSCDNHHVASSMSLISKVHFDDHSMDVDNGEEFQSTHPPSMMLSEKRREVRDSFNEDESVFWSTLLLAQ
jgi:hypothetical protein